ncbi:MAG: phosphoglycerate dehydrogenase [Alphaproteobacteria bacterium]|jgi:phosphoglycerate dehydrogenase-like enzyme|nr:phosphoglycerate dehydrogenase [Alphaproteobacteria bacterium]MBT4018334.1 phosphoglycerate dehydrogenase [Alphaproteobacteria bacterium]MBT4966836.1 phosphoglycerate dehydrogenase [Alphaproteobacteria bacterium]MBT5160708.1 phosphoglycerate dehydrogenase [Alphaproteobacteria bacterium]
MSDALTLLLAGSNSATKEEFLRERLEQPWTFKTWIPGKDRSEFLELLPQADALVGGNVIGDWPATPRLKLYQIPFAGYNWMTPKDIPNGLPFCNTYDHEIPIAEYIMLGMLDWEIGYAASVRDFGGKGWQNIGAGSGPLHGEVFGKTIGIIGYGHIGIEVAKRAKAFGMRTIGIARRERETPAPLDWLGTMTDLGKLLSESDYVLVACPQSEQTLGMINAAQFDQMKDTGVIINVARGPIIDENALYNALKNKQIGGALIDVWYDYPDDELKPEWPSKFPFQELDNIRMTPHNSGWSESLIERRWQSVADNLNRLARGDALHNLVFEGTG